MNLSIPGAAESEPYGIVLTSFKAIKVIFKAYEDSLF